MFVALARCESEGTLSAMAKLGTLYSQDMKGFSSFEADSLPDFDEFDSSSVTISYFKERSALQGCPGCGVAPITSDSG